MSLACGVAAVLASVVALSRPSEANIVYTSSNIVCSTPEPYGSCSIPINLDGGRTADFTIESAVSFDECRKGGGYHDSFVRITPVASPGVVAENGFAAALNAGQPIGAAQTFGGELFMGVLIRAEGCRHDTLGGHWLETGDHYLGLTINARGGTHYGWARLYVACSTSCLKGITVNLIGVAYETTAGKPVVAGQTTEGTGVARPLSRIR